jgi:hypothetical protein
MSAEKLHIRDGETIGFSFRDAKGLFLGSHLPICTVRLIICARGQAISPSLKSKKRSMSARTHERSPHYTLRHPNPVPFLATLSRNGFVACSAPTTLPIYPPSISDYLCFTMSTNVPDLCLSPTLRQTCIRPLGSIFTNEIGNNLQNM